MMRKYESGLSSVKLTDLWSVINVQSFRLAGSDADHCLVVSEIKWMLSVSKWATQNFDVERCNLKKLYSVEFNF
jgi:hypothetical protein